MDYNKTEENVKKPNSKKTLISVIGVIILTVLFLAVFSNFHDLREIFGIIKTADTGNMLLSLLCLLLYFLLWPLSLCLIAKGDGFCASASDSYLIGNTEFFFNGITPFASGGQPIQLYLYTKRGVTASVSTGIIVANFIVLMISSNVFALLSLILYPTFSANFTPSTEWMIVLGFVMNFLTLVFMVLMASCKFIRDLFKNLLLLICKIKFLGKHLEKAVPAFEAYCENAQAAAKEIFRHKLKFVCAVLLRSLSLVFYYAIPFFILRALGVDLALEAIPFIILASSFAITAMVWVPTPGGTGGIEFAFTSIFTTFAGVTSSIGAAGMFLWRGLTFYLLLVFSFISYVAYEAKTKRRKNL